MADTGDAAQAAVRRDEGAHQGRRFVRADEGRPVRLRLVLQDRRRAAALSSARRATAAPKRSSSTATSRPRARPISASAASTIRADHRRLLWAFDDKGSEFYTLRVRDLATASDLADQVPDTGGSGVWNAVERRLLLHARSTPTTARRRSSSTRSARDAAEDRLVYEETDPGFFMSVGGTPHATTGSSSPSTTTRPRSTGCCRPTIRRPSRRWSRRAKPACNTISRKAATSSSSSPTPTAPRTSRS